MRDLLAERETKELLDFFSKLDSSKCSLIKQETDNFHNSFPYESYRGIDLDFIVFCDYFDEFKRLTSELSFDTCSKSIIESTNSCKIRFEDKRGLLLLFEFIKYSEELPLPFLSNVITRSITHTSSLFRVPCTIDETVIRLNEWVLYPKKVHHLKYVAEHYLNLFRFSNSEKLGGKLPQILKLLKIPLLGWPFALILIPKIRKKLDTLLKINLSSDKKDPEKITIQELKVLLSNQYDEFRFNRLDLIVRLLAIENEYKKNDIGWGLYNRMQDIRSNSSNSGASERFKRLQFSIADKGFDLYSSVPISDEGNILDGAHRVACAIYHQEEFVAVNQIFGKRYDGRKKPSYSKSWFEKHEFSKTEIGLIEKRFEDVILKELKFYFQLIIWSPALSYFDEILNDVAKDYSVLSYEKLDLGAEYSNVVHRLYECDDIEQWKIDRKVRAMSSHGTKLGVVRMAIGNPKFRRKDQTNNLISTRVEELKKKIRTKYKGKIENYIFDIIAHVGDNFDHTVAMEEVLETSKKRIGIVQK